ncbi:hypothetical protein [Oscillatoria nigro-viridis]|uniref:hypothetical protein n=1 Tax=Phormidium nigroviride TaxID=482564 RepID=UPI00167FAB0B|nr:hypothetical protein [Oscillatoria nigro-viridis]
MEDPLLLDESVLSSSLPPSFYRLMGHLRGAAPRMPEPASFIAVRLAFIATQLTYILRKVDNWQCGDRIYEVSEGNRFNCRHNSTLK